MDIERDLERLAPVAAPAGLRDRVMDRAAQARNSAALSPRMRILAAACSVVIIAVLMIDPLIGRHDAARIAALLDGQSSARVATEEAARLAEALGGQGSKPAESSGSRSWPRLPAGKTGHEISSKPA